MTGADVFSCLTGGPLKTSKGEFAVSIPDGGGSETWPLGVDIEMTRPVDAHALAPGVDPADSTVETYKVNLWLDREEGDDETRPHRVVMTIPFLWGIAESVRATRLAWHLITEAAGEAQTTYFASQRREEAGQTVVDLFLRTTARVSLLQELRVVLVQFIESYWRRVTDEVVAEWLAAAQGDGRSHD